MRVEVEVRFGRFRYSRGGIPFFEAGRGRLHVWWSLGLVGLRIGGSGG